MHRPTEQTAATAHALAELCLDRLAMQAPLDVCRSPAELDQLAGQMITPAGIGSAAALQLWEHVLAPSCLSVDHPRYLSFIPGAPTKDAAAFDMLVGASSIYGGSWLEAAGAVYAENQALRWIADLAGLPAAAGGAFVQGGTIGNLSALVAARESALHRRGGVRPARWAVVITDETHSSVKHALRVVMDVDMITVAGDDRGRLTGDAIRARLAEVGPAELDGIFAVVATAGTTNLGVVDDIAGIAAVAAEQGWWLHVDGAYGGAGLAAPSARALFAGVEHADSFIVDPHKWLFAPFDCCALLYRDPVLARAAHTQKAGYLDVLETQDWNPSDFAVQLTRRPRGLPLWFSLAVNGTQAYTRAIETTLAVARAGRELIDSAPHVRLLVEPDLSVLIFERIGWQAEDYARWSARLLTDGFAFVTPTSHRGQVCTRFAVVNPVTTAADLAAVLDTMR